MTRIHMVVLGACVALSRIAAAQEPLGDLGRFLREQIALGTAEMAAVGRGEPVVKVLATSHPGDVAVFGIATVAMPRAALLERVLDLSRVTARSPRARSGRFSDPATRSDVAALELEDADLDDLRDCRPGACNFKLPATTMRAIQARMTGSRAQQLATLGEYAREQLVRYVTDYRARGDSALVVYDDRGGVRASDAFARLLGDSRFVFGHVPALTRYLAAYPRAPLTGLREDFYWMQDQPPRLRRTVTVVHRVVYNPPEVPGMTVIAAKQLYASHYFEGALDVSAIVTGAGAGTAASGPQPSHYLTIRRYRFDNLSSGPVNLRGRVVQALQDAMRDELARLR